MLSRSHHPSPSRTRWLVAVVLGGVGILACGGDSGTGPPPPPPPPPVTVALSPTTASLVVTETITLAATVTNSSTAPTFTSSASTIASVSATGLVTGLAVGSATITATVGTASATARITVSDPSVTIDAITQDGQPVNLADVSGAITVQATVVAAAGFTGLLEARLDGVVAGSTPIGPVTAPPALRAAGPQLGPPRTVQVQIETRITEVVDAEEIARLPNGSRSLELLLKLTPEGPGIATTTSSTPLTLNNPDLVNIRGVSFDGNTFTDLSDITWRQGSMHFTAHHVRYGGGPTGTFTGVKGTIQTPGGPVEIEAAPSSALGAAAEFLFDADTPPPLGIKGVEGELQFQQGFIKFSGDLDPTPFPIGNNLTPTFDGLESSWSADNAGPTSSVSLETESFYVNDRWQLNDHWSFNLGFRYEEDDNGPATVTDGGSGLQGGSWNARDPFGTLLVEDVQTGADLPRTNGTTIFLETIAIDRIGNRTIWPLMAPGGSPVGIGTDFIPPTASLMMSGSFLSGIELNPTGGSWRVDVDDPKNQLGGSSGASDDLMLALVRYLEGLDDEDACPVGDHSGGGCMHVRQAGSSGLLSFDSEWLPPGKYRGQVRALDNADNQSAPVEFWFFRDALGVAISDMFGPPSIPEGGVSYAFGATFHDDVDIVTVMTALEYGSSPFRVGNPAMPIGDPLSPTLTPQFLHNRDVFTYRSLEGVGSSSPAPTGDIQPLSAYYVGATDIGGNISKDVLDLTARAPAPPTSGFGASGMDWFDLSYSALTICDPSGGHDCGSTPTSVDVVAHGWIPDNGMDIDISDLRFHALVANSYGLEMAVPVGPPGSLTINDFSGFFRWDWTATIPASEFPPCTIGFVAIGRNPSGAGLYTNPEPIFVARPASDLDAWDLCTAP